MKSLLYKSSLLVLVVSATSCFSSDERNYEYFPNMYESEAYEAYQEYEIFAHDQEAMLPVEGSIPRGWMPFGYPNTIEGYESAKVNLENPLPYTEENVTEGQQLFNIYCAVCHGDKGDGQGILAEREKILGIPSYNAPGRDITAGSTYYVMYYGKNTMGSYSNQTTEIERWKIAMYVMDLKRALNGEPKREFEKPVSQTPDIGNVTIGLNMNAVPTTKSEVPSGKDETTVETNTLNEE